ncbi:LPS O-antigen chain length determinant protein WzzB [Rahnella variigena]|jgi:chain length determinant protein (polysaccharide antigen chain regulator)|uniref:Chain length determinant protein n=1 Tax=Rahnella variigena TaxID=574964 RepID=A0ABX9PZX5_9GAMM|nr:LPS O-antigen chain length determinant protein WzzB [Rahnella variigena]RJT52645.1 LPS O-antigen chain length determinant protein WzzB [Rahnella variigena]RKF69178.1 LPS O-antigen chain length determinant protein WzzB [Rahnella variigena]
MNQDSNMMKNHSVKHNEEVDLIDVLMQLWRGKMIIIFAMVLTILLAIGYLYVAKEKWTSDAIVTYPDSGQIANYNNAMSVLYSQNSANAPTVIDVQQRFFGRFNAAISALSEQLGNQADPEKLVIAPAVKDQPVPLKISYTAKTAGEAQKTLTTYIQQINKRVVTELDNDLQTSINSKIEDLKEDLATQEKVAQEKKDLRLKMLNQALLVAQQAKIKDTLVQQAETLSEDTLFVLGSDALSATIKNEATRPLPFDASYYQARQTLLAISALKSKPDSTYALRYVMKPDLPIHRDSPKKSLTLIFGALIGIIIGATIVLTRNMARSYSLRS